MQGDTSQGRYELMEICYEMFTSSVVRVALYTRDRDTVAQRVVQFYLPI